MTSKVDNLRGGGGKARVRQVLSHRQQNECHHYSSTPAEHSRLSSGEGPERLSITPQSQAGTPIAPSANSSSKKRAKSCKQAGLRALLAKNKEASQTSGGGLGLDLLDLMK